MRHVRVAAVGHSLTLNNESIAAQERITYA